jgi:hypothetical protein
MLIEHALAVLLHELAALRPFGEEIENGFRGSAELHAERSNHQRTVSPGFHPADLLRERQPWQLQERSGGWLRSWPLTSSPFPASATVSVPEECT